MTDKYKIILVAGARPNFMKVAPIYFELKKHKRFQPILVHTGQHYDRDMSDVFFRDLGMPKPDIHLGVGSASHSEQTAKVMIEFEKILMREDPDLVIVVGDVNSTIACSLATVKYRCTRKPDKRDKPERLNRPLVAHVEAGLRSYDRTMPEEINRLLTDQISDYLFTTCRDAGKNLMREGIPKNKIFFVGNVMIDTLERMLKRTKKVKKVYSVKLDQGDSPFNDLRGTVPLRPYALVTLHRPSNVDEPKTLRGIMSALQQIARKVPVIFPVHPRTRNTLKNYGFAGYQNNQDISKSDSCCHPESSEGSQMSGILRISDETLRMTNGACRNNIIFTPPLGYLEFMGLMANAALVLTDSGGIQEETTILGVPCLTLRNNTERPITITEGTNKLVGTDPVRIVKESEKVLAKVRKEWTSGWGWDARSNKQNRPKRLNRPNRLKYWDGKAAGRIVKILKTVASQRDRIIRR